MSGFPVMPPGNYEYVRADRDRLVVVIPAADTAGQEALGGRLVGPPTPGAVGLMEGSCESPRYIDVYTESGRLIRVDRKELA